MSVKAIIFFVGGLIVCGLLFSLNPLLVLSLVLFQILIILHEYGHFLVAKRNGVEVEEFGLGFPPKIISRKLGKGIFRGNYSLNYLPLGGFVRLKGENDEAKGPRTFGRTNLWVKTKIILAGVAVNFLIAIFLFTLLAFLGMPRLLPSAPDFPEDQFTLASDTQIIEDRTIVSHVFEDSPAALSGLQVGDELISITNNNSGQTFTVEDTDGLVDQTMHLAGQPVSLQVIRDQQPLQLTTTLKTIAESQKTNTGRLGVSTHDFVIQKNTWSAPLTGVVLTAQYTKITFQGLWRAVSALVAGDTQTASSSVSGPVGIFFVLRAGANQGWRLVLMIIALLSLTLAIINALPIPALDGGRLALIVLFRKILKRPLTKQTETRIVATSMGILLILVVLITIVDIRRFIL